MTTLFVRPTRNNPPELKQSRVKRDWMDSTFNKHAYQCRPMTVANVMGWELVLDEEITVRWDGGNHNVKIFPDTQRVASAGIIGTVSFNVGWRFKTEPGFSVWIGGSPNLILPGAHPLSGIIPTDWWPDEFQMNWMISDKDRDVVFPAGFPFMFFTLVNTGTIEETTVELDKSTESMEFINSRSRYGQQKMKRNTDEPWTWTKGIKTGVDADGNRIGPSFNGLPKLQEPDIGS